jgi:hypothetical protein
VAARPDLKVGTRKPNPLKRKTAPFIKGMERSVASQWGCSLREPRFGWLFLPSTVLTVSGSRGLPISRLRNFRLRIRRPLSSLNPPASQSAIPNARDSQPPLRLPRNLFGVVNLSGLILEPFSARVQLGTRETRGASIFSISGGCSFPLRYC